MEYLNGKWALVTGASSGFGVEFARLLAKRKASVVLAARRTAPMEQVAKELRQQHFVQAIVEGIDLGRKGAATELKSRLDDRGIAIDILINNAGFGEYGPFLEQPKDRVADMLQLNVVTLTELTHVFAEDMADRRCGHILLTASLLGYQAVPGYAVYAATKAYVLLLGEALHQELRPHGVSVTALCPGTSPTAFPELAGQRTSFLLRFMATEPRFVAEAGVAAMLSRRAAV